MPFLLKTCAWTVRELTDWQALELQVIENIQRVDVHRSTRRRDTPPSLNFNPTPTPSKASHGYNPRQALEKNSNLARTAQRYKVDSAKIATGARAELSKAKVNGEGRPAQKSTTLKPLHRKQS
jgi:ParB-like chromosome segregation protein Spo0J